MPRVFPAIAFLALAGTTNALQVGTANAEQGFPMLGMMMAPPPMMMMPPPPPPPAVAAPPLPPAMPAQFGYGMPGMQMPGMQMPGMQMPSQWGVPKGMLKQGAPASPELADKVAAAVEDELGKVSKAGTDAVYQAANAVFEVIKEWPENAEGQMEVTDDMMHDFTHKVQKQVEAANQLVPGYIDKAGIRNMAIEAAKNALKSTECHAQDSADCGTAQYKAWTAKVKMLSDLGMGPERADAEKTQANWDSFVKEQRQLAHEAALKGAGPDAVRNGVRQKISDTQKRLFNVQPMSNLVAEAVKVTLKKAETSAEKPRK